MNATVAELVEKALLLPTEARAELLEAIWEKQPPADDFITSQITVVAGRMDNVRNGTSPLIPAADAHRMVLESLRETP